MSFASRSGARSLLKKIVEDNPDMEDEEIFHEFSDKCAPNFPEIVRYWFSNNLHAMRSRTPRRNHNAPSDAVTTKARMARLVLMDLVLPSGKMLRDSTFREAGEAGGWLVRLGKCGKPGEIIGATMTERDVSVVRNRAA